MKAEMKIKKTCDAESIADMLRQLADAFREKTVCFEKGGEFVTLRPGGGIDFALEAGVKKEKQKVSLEMSWREMTPEAEQEEELKISSQEPELTAPEADTEAPTEEAPAV